MKSSFCDDKTQGNAADIPIADNQSEAGRAKNRRTSLNVLTE